MVAASYPPQSNLLPAGEQASSILFSNLFALLSSDIYTHFCLVGRYLHCLPGGAKYFPKPNVVAKGVWQSVAQQMGQDEEGSNSDCKVGAHPRVFYYYYYYSPEGPGSRNISPQRGEPVQALGDPGTLQDHAHPIMNQNPCFVLNAIFVIAPSVPIKKNASGPLPS